MKITMLLASAAMIGVVFLAAPLNAQGVKQTVPIAKVDVQNGGGGLPGVQSDRQQRTQRRKRNDRQD